MEAVVTTRQHPESSRHAAWTGLIHLVLHQMLFLAFGMFARVCDSVCVCVFEGSYQRLTCDPAGSV